MITEQEPTTPPVEIKTPQSLLEVSAKSIIETIFPKGISLTETTELIYRQGLPQNLEDKLFIFACPNHKLTNLNFDKISTQINSNDTIVDTLDRSRKKVIFDIKSNALNNLINREQNSTDEEERLKYKLKQLEEESPYRLENYTEKELEEAKELAQRIYSNLQD